MSRKNRIKVIQKPESSDYIDSLTDSLVSYQMAEILEAIAERHGKPIADYAASRLGFRVD